ncbi:MAG: helix-turn-helix domain-containing protein, partial [Gemmatimonadaceae bacterium]
AHGFGLPPKHFTQAALQALAKKDFPGNVRQLENLCRRLAVIAPGAQIRRDDLGVQNATVPTGSQLQGEEWEAALRDWARRQLAEGRAGLHAQARERFERALFDAALETHGGHRQKAAAALGLGRNTLTRKLGSSRKRPKDPR